MADGYQQRRDDKAALAKSNLDELRKLLGKMQKQLEYALPKFMTPERMIRVATTTVQKVPKLLEAAPVTVVGAIMQAAALGLEPDNVTGSAYLVPFWNSKLRRLECNLIPGYRGLMALARRSKEIASFDARVVKQGDVFDYEYGSSQYLKHKPASIALEQDKESGRFLPAKGGEPDTTHAYMIAFFNGSRLTNGNPPCQFDVMPRWQLERAKHFTKSRDKEGNIVGPWIEHEDAMFTKSVIRRGAKLLPFSIELMTAVSLDERHLLGKSQNLGALVAEDLGINFAGSDDDDETGNGGEGGNGGNGEAEIDAALVQRINAAFDKLDYREAQRTAKWQEFRGRYQDLAEWIEAEIAKGAKTAGTGTTAAAETVKAGPPANGNGHGDTGKRPSAAQWRI